MTLWTEVADDENYKKVLDHGFVGLVDCMGDDHAIVQAARASYGKGTKSVSEDRALIRYLMRHMHTSVFEMVEFKFHLKMPIFVMRQHVRHRMASINEYSGRYSVMNDEFYIPDRSRLQAQSSTNKQGSGDTLDDLEAEIALNTIQRVSAESYLDYLSLIGDEHGRSYGLVNPQGLTRELARTVLPINNYTELYWKIDLKNLLHYINLRADSHAQWEIQQFANIFAEFVRAKCPLAYEAFEDYWQWGNIVTVSRMEKNLMQELIEVSNSHNMSIQSAWQQVQASFETPNQLLEFFNLSKRELLAFQQQWGLA
jgi:thymidylate synthase (FAD)